MVKEVPYSFDIMVFCVLPNRGIVPEVMRGVSGFQFPSLAQFFDVIGDDQFNAVGGFSGEGRTE